MVGSFPGCCERAASGQMTDTLPRSVMKSRRLMGLTPRPSMHCIAAKAAHSCPFWVNRVDPVYSNPLVAKQLCRFIVMAIAYKNTYVLNYDWHEVRIVEFCHVRPTQEN